MTVRLVVAVATAAAAAAYVNAARHLAHRISQNQPFLFVFIVTVVIVDNFRRIRLSSRSPIEEERLPHIR